MKKPSIQFLESCILINKEILVLGDFHIGYNKYLFYNRGFKNHFNEIMDELDFIFKKLKKDKIILKKIIVLGDLKHEFGKISNIEWEEILKILDYLNKKIDKSFQEDRIVLIKGNHDKVLKFISKKRDICLVDYYKIENICFLHGDIMFKECLNSVDVLVIGHYHPAITISDKYKTEKYKCFLKGNWKNKLVYILPSFSPFSYGYDLNQINNNSNFGFIEKKDLKRFEVIIYNKKDDEIYNFGKLKKFV